MARPRVEDQQLDRQREIEQVLIRVTSLRAQFDSFGGQAENQANLIASLLESVSLLAEGTEHLLNLERLRREIDSADGA